MKTFLKKICEAPEGYWMFVLYIAGAFLLPQPYAVFAACAGLFVFTLTHIVVNAIKSAKDCSQIHMNLGELRSDDQEEAGAK